MSYQNVAMMVPASWQYRCYWKCPNTKGHAIDPKVHTVVICKACSCTICGAHLKKHEAIHTIEALAK